MVLRLFDYFDSVCIQAMDIQIQIHYHLGISAELGLFEHYTKLAGSVMSHFCLIPEAV